ncbi:hypothetical protein GCM10008907_10190 [Clostridium sartagoforme]
MENTMLLERLLYINEDGVIDILKLSLVALKYNNRINNFSYIHKHFYKKVYEKSH